MAKERLYTSKLRKESRCKKAKKMKACPTKRKEADLRKAFPHLRVQLDSPENPLALLSVLKDYFIAGRPAT